MIIWIASYPKSGNTWIRSLLSAYLFTDDGKFNFTLLKKIEQFSSKGLSPQNTNQSNYQAIVSKNWIPAQKIINSDNKIHFLKTHNACCIINGNKFTDKFNTVAAIYIVRDPRNIVTSLAHHYEFTLDEAFNFLTNQKKIIFPQEQQNGAVPKIPVYDFSFLGNWSEHYRSWKNIGFCPVKVVRYEDILLNSKEVFLSILNFLSKFTEIKLDEKKISNVLESTSFSKLNEMESKEGFDESVISDKTKKKIKFFNLGKENNWKKLLNNKIIEKIGYSFKNEMRELNYL